MHAIVAGFLVGLVLSKTIKDKPIESKLHVLSYGIFIPIFFLKVGIETDLTIFFKASSTILILLVIVTSLHISKISTGYICGKIMGFPPKNDYCLVFLQYPNFQLQLVITLTALDRGLIDTNLQVSIVLLVTTVMLAPIFVGLLAKETKTINQQETLIKLGLYSYRIFRLSKFI